MAEFLSSRQTMTDVDWKKRQILWLMVIILLAGATLRWAQLGGMEEMLNSDEAANGLDALSLIQSPRFTPFFPSYTGRESGWHYWLVPFLLAFGIRPFAIRLAATMAGILTLAAIYPLGRELLPRRAALWSTAALAILYWHVHLSHVGFRAILLPLIGSLAMALLLHAHRTNRFKGWVSSGVLFGLLPYTYFSARMWLGYAGLMLIFWGIRERSKRRGILLAGGITAVLFLPLLLYTTFNPAASFNRIGEVSVLSLEGIINNGLAWLGAWFWRGDENVMLNLPGRPILDWFLGVPFLAGLICLWWIIKERWCILWIAGLAFLSVVPSLLSDHAPHFLRAIGLVIPVAFVIGAGVYFLEQLLQRYTGRAAVLLPFIWLLAAGGIVYQDLTTRWLNHPDLPEQMEVSINRAANFVMQAAPPEAPVYFAPVSRLNPTLLFRAAELAPRHVTAFDGSHCWVETAVPAVYVLLTDSQAAPIRPLIQTLTQDGAQVMTASERYTILLTVPADDKRIPNAFTATFDDAITLAPTFPLPERVYPGDVIPIDLSFQALRPFAGEYNLFIHLYGTPSPYDGGPIWSQTDSPLCQSYPMSLWQPFEIISQLFELRIPADIPPGLYTIVTGLYESEHGERLPLTAPTPNQWNHFELKQIEVAGPDE